MNVNGARFHLLLGQEDWGACSVLRGGARRRLSAQWKKPVPPEDAPAWDSPGHLTLAQVDARIPDTPGEAAFRPDSRRAIATDRAGNLYFVGDDRRSIRVVSRGSGKASAFWPASPGPRPKQGGFGDAEPPVAFAGPITALAVTDENYLVAATPEGFLRFDLVAGGGPERRTLPTDVAGVTVTDLCPGPCGGLWLLDGPARRLYRLDRNLGFVEDAEAQAQALPAQFQPLSGQPRSEPRHAPAVRSLPEGPEPLALAAAGDRALILTLEGTPDAPVSRLIAAAPAGELRTLAILPRACFALAAIAGEGAWQVFLAGTGGNQAHRIVVSESADGLAAKVDVTTIPMRRFGGRGLVASGAYALYDSGPEEPLWVPLLAQRRQAFAPLNVIVTPRFDSHAPQCTWDRIRLDACIPPGTQVLIEARASDDPAVIGSAAESGWQRQPVPYLNRDGGELPGKRAPARQRTDPITGSGAWDLLLQDVIGRYCELRITLAGDGRFTPHLRALRLWYPRFSWSERFLPAVYREDRTDASFLERFLANMEGIATVTEDRIAAAQVLFDTRTAPDEALDWLAGWYDMALDPRWDEPRRRLLVRNAAQFFGWRGTARGILAALRLAFEKRPDDAIFALDRPSAPDPRGIRIVEGFSTRPALAPVQRPDDAAPGLPSQPASAGSWSPAEGAVGLARRWALVLDPAADPAAPLPAGFDLAPAAHPEAAWPSFARAQIGFVPAAGGMERERWTAFQHGLGIADPLPALPSGPDQSPEAWRAFTGQPSPQRALWQRFLFEKHRRIERLNEAWNTAWDNFAEVPLTDVVPHTEAAIRDWLAFEGQVLAVAAAAHRFSVLLPRRSVDQGFAEEQDMLAVARRLVAIEKPAHTEFDVRFYWAMNRLGEARTGLDTQIGQGSRAPELVPAAVVGRAWLGAGFVAGPPVPGPGREVARC